MSEIQKQREIREMVDNTPVRDKLLEVKHWEKTMKQKEKDLKAKIKADEQTQAIESAAAAAPIRRMTAENGTGTTKVNGDGDHHHHQEKDEKHLLPDSNKAAALKVAQERSSHLTMANEEKERGNKLVTVKDYKNAIPHYNRAIELNPDNPAFFLNRALCHLRLNDCRASIADCNSALKLDKDLVKAYFRRMHSHITMQEYDSAMADCIEMIKRDPKNEALRKEFNRIKQMKLDKESGKKVTNTPAETKKKVEEVYWEPRPKKLWSKFGVDEEEIRFQDKAPHLRSKKPLRRIPITETYSDPTPVEAFPDHIVDKLFNNFTGESTSTGPTAGSSTSRSPTALFSPYTPLYGSFNPPPAKSPVVPATTPLSPMSSSALNLSSCDAERSIDDIFGGMAIAAKKEETKTTTRTATSDQVPEISFLPAPPSFDSSDDKTDVMKPVPVVTATNPTPAAQFVPPTTVTEYPIPKTGVQFAATWKSLDELQRFYFLRQCQLESKIIGKLGASLDDALLSELLDCMHSCFCAKDLNIGDILLQLSENSEIGILAMMMGEIERRMVEDLWSYVKNRQELAPEVCLSIERAFSG